MKQNENNEQWLDEIRQTMTDYQEELPADGWEKLAAAMEKVAEEIVLEEKSQTKIVPMWMRRVAAVVLLGVIGAGGVYYFFEMPENEEVSVLKETGKQQEKIVQPVTLAEEDGTAEDKNVVERHETLRSKPVKAQGNCVQPSSVQASVREPAEKETQAAETQSEKSFSDMHNEEKAVLLAMEAKSGRKPASNSSWNVGLRLGRHGMTNYSNGGEQVPDNDFTSPGILEDNRDSTSHSSTSQAVTRALTHASQPEDKVVSSDHHLSWSAGVSVSKQLHKNVAFETGLVYTYLSSDVQMSQSGQQHQQLHYLGVPLKLNVMLAENLHWQFYTGFGTMVEHLLHGKRGNTNLHLNDWQWSMNGGLGVQYKLTNLMGLYFEPGVNYFFSNGTEVPSLRTESPFSINLQIGVRFGL